MRELSLFTGAGGGILGTKLLGWTVVGCVEWDDYCQRILRQRMEDGIIEQAPIYGDIRAFISEGYARRYRGMVDVITAGFPCQPFSVAGKQKGEDDDRNMWPATYKVIRLVRPEYLLLENVPGLLSSGYFGRVLGDLAESGYDVRWIVLGADDVGAPHKRSRLWIMAHTDKGRFNPSRQGLKQTNSHKKTNRVKRCSEDVAHSKSTNDTQQNGQADSRGQIIGKREAEVWAEPRGCSEGTDNVADTDTVYAQGEQPQGDDKENRQEQGERQAGLCSREGYWTVEPNVGRVANGVASRVDRLKAIGNGQVPAVVRAAWEMIYGD